MCRDIDLLRDETLLASAAATSAAGETSSWRCSHCANSLNKEEVENRLLSEVELKVATFLVQDFRCKKIHEVNKRLATAFSPRCEIVEMDHSVEMTEKELGVLLQVARLHGFESLLAAVQEILG
jgi:hypothetical protein